MFLTSLDFITFHTFLIFVFICWCWSNFYTSNITIIILLKFLDREGGGFGILTTLKIFFGAYTPTRTALFTTLIINLIIPPIFHLTSHTPHFFPTKFPIFSPQFSSSFHLSHLQFSLSLLFSPFSICLLFTLFHSFFLMISLFSYFSLYPQQLPSYSTHYLTSFPPIFHPFPIVPHLSPFFHLNISLYPLHFFLKIFFLTYPLSLNSHYCPPHPST